MTSLLKLKVIKEADWEGDLQIFIAAAPDKLTIKSAPKEMGEVRLYPDQKKAVISMGEKEDISSERIRKVGGKLVKWLVKNSIQQAALQLSTFEDLGLSPPKAVKALSEGLQLGAFEFKKHRSERNDSSQITIFFLVNDDISDIFETVERVNKITEAVNLTREWAHEPPNVINPETLSERVLILAQKNELNCHILDEKKLIGIGAGAIVAVGKGSQTPARLIVLEYAGADPVADSRPVVLAGKAITFDTGGYSIKTREGIVGMKFDKCGGMAVIGTLLAAARLKLKTPVVGLIPAAENMISGEAYRPNDIVTTLSGKTVEIISADAEGRLVLCDALTFAQRQYNPRAIIDLATLTGGVIVALGNVRAGIMSNNDDLSTALMESGERTYERLWPFPLDDEYFELIRGEDSDLKNSGGRKAHPIIGGIFLKQFIESDIPWAHIDIAGTARTDTDLPYYQKGATGFGVRLLIDYLYSLE